MRLLPLISGFLRLALWIKVQRCELVENQSAVDTVTLPSTSPLISSTPNGVRTIPQARESTASSVPSSGLEKITEYPRLQNFLEDRMNDTETVDYDTVAPTSKAPTTVALTTKNMKCSFKICLIIILVFSLVVGTGICVHLFCRKSWRQRGKRHKIVCSCHGNYRTISCRHGNRKVPQVRVIRNSLETYSSCALHLGSHSNVYVDALDLEIEDIVMTSASSDQRDCDVEKDLARSKPAKPAKPVRPQHDYVNITVERRLN